MRASALGQAANFLKYLNSLKNKFQKSPCSQMQPSSLRFFLIFFKFLVTFPVCNIAGIKERSTKSPRFRCNDKHEFDSPKVEITSCNKYKANFGNSFVEIKRTILARDLKSMCLTDSDQLSIQRLDFEKILALINEVKLVKDGSKEVGVPYTTRVVVASTKNREPFEVDPDAIDRATSNQAVKILNEVQKLGFIQIDKIPDKND